MYIFAEPMTEDQIDALQSSSNAKVEEFERNILGLCNDNAEAQESENDDGKWADMQANVEKEMEKDEISATAFEVEGDGLGGVGDEAGSTGNLSQPHEGNSIVAKTDSEDIDEDSVAVSRGDQDIQYVDEHEGDRMLDLDREDQEGISQAEHDPTTSDGLAFQDGEESTQHSDEAASTVNTSSPQAPSQEHDVSNAQADAALAKENPPPSSSKELLAMTLTVRNQVNKKFVVRPENLSPRDRWTVEYALANVQPREKAWTLYQASQTRRKKQLENLDEDEGKTVDFYIRNLRELSKKGKKWREQQDKQDMERPKVVFGA